MNIYAFTFDTACSSEEVWTEIEKGEDAVKAWKSLLIRLMEEDDVDGSLEDYHIEIYDTLSFINELTEDGDRGLVRDEDIADWGITLNMEL